MLLIDFKFKVNLLFLGNLGSPLIFSVSMLNYLATGNFYLLIVNT